MALPCSDVIFFVAVRASLKTKAVGALFFTLFCFHQAMATATKVFKDVAFSVFSSPKCISKVASRAVNLYGDRILSWAFLTNFWLKNIVAVVGVIQD